MDIKHPFSGYKIRFQALSAPLIAGMLKKKKSIVFFAAIALCLSILTTGTIAYFTAEETAYNVITTGNLSMNLVEETADGKPWPQNGISGVMPGMTIVKKPYVINEGSVDFYTRISLSMQATSKTGEPLSTACILLDINRSDWIEHEGFYYYHKAVAPGESTAPLFTKVSFDSSMDNAYMFASIKIDVYAEAVQSRNNGDHALSATGWQSELSGE